MIDSIKKIVLASYAASEPRGVFFSLFDQGGKLLLSNGVVQSNKSLEMVIDTLYHGLIEKNLDGTKQIYVDVVTSVKEESNMDELLKVQLKDFGVVLMTVDASKSAVLLPNTYGITDIKQALTTMKKKHAIEGNVLIYVFQTERFIIDKQ